MAAGGAETASAAVSVAKTAQPLAVDNRDDRRRAAGRDADDIPAYRGAGERRNIAIRFGLDFLDAVIAGHQSGDNQRFVKRGAASGNDLERFAGRKARAGDAQRKGTARALLIAAGVEQNFINNQCQAVEAILAGYARGNSVHQRITGTVHIDTSICRDEGAQYILCLSARRVHDGKESRMQNSGMDLHVSWIKCFSKRTFRGIIN